MSDESRDVASRGVVAFVPRPAGGTQLDRIAFQDPINCGCQGWGVGIAQFPACWIDDLWESPHARSDHGSASRHRFNRCAAERFGPLGRDHHSPGASELAWDKSGFDCAGNIDTVGLSEVNLKLRPEGAVSDEPQAATLSACVRLSPRVDELHDSLLVRQTAEVQHVVTEDGLVPRVGHRVRFHLDSGIRHPGASERRGLMSADTQEAVDLLPRRHMHPLSHGHGR
jgi:hypothetical protein